MDDTAAETYITKILSCVRNMVETRKLSTSRLPNWVNSAEIETGRVGNTTLFNIEEASKMRDTYRHLGDFPTDTSFFLKSEGIDGAKAFTQPPQPDHLDFESDVIGKPTLLMSNPDNKSGYTIKIDRASMYSFQDGSYHSPLFLAHFYYQLAPEDEILKTRYIPLAICVHDLDFKNAESHLKVMIKRLFETLQTIHNSPLGTHLQHENQTQKAIISRLDDSSIVLGSYDGAELENELEMVRDHLCSQKYNAYLIKDLPGHPSQSIEQKVKLWSSSSKFCVLIDRDPSGHLVEFSDISSEEVPLAVLRQKDEGSSYMIAHKHFTNKYVELFEFHDTPLEVIDDAIEWADNLTSEMTEKYNNIYPWR
jgi:hypothetical protein